MPSSLLVAAGLQGLLLGPAAGSGAAFVGARVVSPEVPSPPDEPAAPEGSAHPGEPPAMDEVALVDESSVESAGADAGSEAEPGASAVETVPAAEPGASAVEIVPEAEPGSGEVEVPQDEAEPDEDWFGDDADDEPFPELEDEDDEALAADDYDPLRDSPQAIRAQHWVRGGIVIMSAGGVLLVGAILMGASDPCNLAWGNSCQTEARNRAALTMGIPAALMIGGGAAALGIGMKRRQRISLELSASRRGGGLVVRGRF